MMGKKKEMLRLQSRVTYLEQVLDDARTSLLEDGYNCCESALNHPSKGGEPFLGYWDGFSIYWQTKLSVIQKATEMLHYEE